MKFVHEYCILKDKSTEIFPPLLLKLPYICDYAVAMPRAKKRSAKAKDDSLVDITVGSYSWGWGLRGVSSSAGVLVLTADVLLIRPRALKHDMWPLISDLTVFSRFWRRNTCDFLPTKKSVPKEQLLYNVHMKQTQLDVQELIVIAGKHVVYCIHCTY